MSDQLFRLGTTQWWIQVDVQNERILDQFNKPQLTATIAAIQNQLASYPDPSVAEQDLIDVLMLVDNFTGATKERKDRVKKLLRDMWEAYQQDPQMLNRAELAARLERDQTLLAKMV